MDGLSTAGGVSVQFAEEDGACLVVVGDTDAVLTGVLRGVSCKCYVLFDWKKLAIETSKVHKF